MTERIYGLIGRKLGHSFSETIHRELGNPDYRLIELEPEQLDAFFRDTEITGLNVTIPYKTAVVPFCATLSDEARAIGSVNTIVPGPSGLHGHNTDAHGLSYMARWAGISFSGKKALVFGSGGSSLTAQYVAAREGARNVVVVSRTGEDNYDNLSRHYDAEILVNATPVGMYPNSGHSITDLSLFPCCEGVLDMVYNPLRTALLMQAEERKISHANGLPMLVAQGTAAAGLFMRREFPDSEPQRILGLLRAEKENIVLIGMPGSGKTTVGEALARITGRELIDLDTQIEKASGLPIPAIFKRMGEDAFRKLENEQAARFGCQSGKILVTGGGIIKREENYPLLRQNGRIYHIIREIGLLDRTGRPLSMNADLEAMYRERLPLYTRFRDAAVESTGTPEDTAQTLWRDFCEYTRH